MPTFATLEAQRIDIVTLLQDWTAVELAYRPVPDAWSATEGLDHIVKV